MTVHGTVAALLYSGIFVVELDNGPTVRAYTSGNLRKFHVPVRNGDRVTVELSPYDLSRGRITEREHGNGPIAGGVAVR